MDIGLDALPPSLCIYSKAKDSIWGPVPMGLKSCVMAADIIDVAIEDPKKVSRNLFLVTAKKIYIESSGKTKQSQDNELVKLIFAASSAVDRLSWMKWIQIAKMHATQSVSNKQENFGSRKTNQVKQNRIT
jgi:hypothetical protein